MNWKTFLLSSLYTLLCCSTLFAQGENNIWAFGVHAGIDFNSGKPEFFISKSKTSEGCASVCDKSGQLLFYCDGQNVWNKNHTVMPNGGDILGNNPNPSFNGSATQGVTIVPFIYNDGKYYIFTVDCQEAINPPISPGYLRYSIVDMNANDGMGDVTLKNIVIDSGMGEKLTVTVGNNCFFWLLSHAYGSDEFKAYKINTNAEISVAASSFVSSFSKDSIERYKRSYMSGEMKVSPDGKLIAITNNEPKTCKGVELYHFDYITGKITEPVFIHPDDSSFLYGIEFSPDGRFLYIGAGDGGRIKDRPMWQYDVSLLPDVQATKASRTNVGLSKWGGMRVGPDNKIYVSSFNNKILHTINNPNAKGDSCDITPLIFDIPDDVYTMLSQGGRVLTESALQIPPTYTRTDTVLCDQQELTITAPDGFDSYLWHDGFTGQSRNISGKNIWVKSSNNCSMQVDTVNTSNCNDCLWVPNAFSPNRDGINDLFRPVGQHIDHFEIYIYNRWGNLVFSSNNTLDSWNGMYGADLCDVGSYFYYIKARCKSGRDFTLKGDITLLR